MSEFPSHADGLPDGPALSLKAADLYLTLSNLESHIDRHLDEMAVFLPLQTRLLLDRVRTISSVTAHTVRETLLS